MNKIKLLSVLLASLFLISCGGGGSDGCSGGALVGNCSGTTTGGGGTTTPGAGAPDDIQVFVSSTDLFTDISRNNVVDVFAIVTDNAGTVLEGVIVTFSASNNASITVLNAVTDSGGIANATLNNGTDLSNRTTVVSATVSGTTVSNSSPTVNIQGTTLTLTGGTPLVTAGESTDFVALLADSLGQGIENAALTISSNAGYSTSGDTSTGVGGQASIQLTAISNGSYTLSVSALGETDTADFDITSDIFAFQSPAADAEVNIGTPQTIVLRRDQGGVLSGFTVNFSSTRGTITASSVTDASGDTTVPAVTISSTDAGVATIVATDALDPTLTNTLQVEFVAVQAAGITLSTDKTRVDVGEQTNITATVTDPTGNRVKNKVVDFSIFADPSNGTIFPATAVTDSNGEARTVYTGGSTPTATNGVELRASVTETAPPGTFTDSVLLTVAGVARDVTIGTGNTLFEIGTALYAKEFAVIVKDGVGNAVPGALVEVSLLSEQFIKGELYTDPLVFSGWRVLPFPLSCANEDVNNDGILDLLPANEDLNGNGVLDPGNRAVVSAVDPATPVSTPCTFGGSGGSQAADVITNDNGLARVCIYYAQSDALWVETNITASTQVSGTEFGDDLTFVLQVSGDDVDDENVAPPNQFSPFGQDTATCLNDL